MRRSAEISGRMTIDRRKFSQQLADAKAELRRFRTDAQNISAPQLGGGGGGGLGGMMGKGAANMFAAAQMGGLVVEKLKETGKAAFEAEERVVALAQQLKAASDGSEDVGEQMVALAKSGSKPGLNFETAVENSAALQHLGLSARDSRRYIEQIGNAIAYTGGNAENSSRFMTQFQQSLTSPKAVEMDELKSMNENMKGFLALTAGLDRSKPREFLEGVIQRMEKLPRAAKSATRQAEELEETLKLLAAVKLNNLGVGETVGKVSGGSTKFVEELAGLEDDVRKFGGKFNPDAAALKAKKEGKEQMEKDKAAEAAKKQLEADEERSKLWRQEYEIIMAEHELEKARLDDDQEGISVAEEKLAVLRETATIAKELNISERLAEAHVRAQAKIRAEQRKELAGIAADKEKESAGQERERANEQLLIDTLRARGKVKEAQAREDERRKNELMTGPGKFSAEQAGQFVKDERANEKDQAFFDKTGRRKIKGATFSGDETGLDSNFVTPSALDAWEIHNVKREENEPLNGYRQKKMGPMEHPPVSHTPRTDRRKAGQEEVERRHAASRTRAGGGTDEKVLNELQAIRTTLQKTLEANRQQADNNRPTTKDRIR